MVTIASFRKISLTFRDAIELPHFHKTSFRVKRKIFTTFDEVKNLAMVKLSLVDQSVFGDWNKDIIYPVPGGWGKQGAACIDLSIVKLKVPWGALRYAYNLVAKRK